MDQVDKMIEEWRTARSDLDVTAIGPIARLSRALKLMHTVADQTFAAHGLNMAGFDVLSGLRRSGPPFALSVGDLLSTMMITSGTMTNRIDQLEKAGLVERASDPDDARKAIVSLTSEGLNRIEKAIGEHTTAQRELLLKGLSREEIKQLDDLLRKLTNSLGV